MGKTSWNGVLGRAWVTRWPLSAIKQPSSEDPLFLQPLEGVIHPTIGIRALLTDPKSVAPGLVDVERSVHAGVPELPRIYPGIWNRIDRVVFRRSQKPRVGEQSGSTVRTRGTPSNYKKKKN